MAQETTQARPAITLSELAARRVAEFIDREGGVGMRFGVRKTGCSGWAYVVDLAAEATPDDAVFEDRGVRILVDRDSLPLVAGTRIDYVRQGLNHGFEFDNPNVTDECGCGESFAVSSG